MPRNVTLSLRMSSDLTPAQNERLRRAMEAYKRDHCNGSVTELANRLGRKQPSISDVLNRKGGASYGTATRFAELVGKTLDGVIGPAEAAAGEKLDEGFARTTFVMDTSVLLDVAAGTFLLKLGEQPGLKMWVHNHPQSVTVRELVRAIHVLESGAAAGYARASDQQPHAGWDTFFQDLRAGKFEGAPRRPHPASVDQVRSAEIGELGGAVKTTIALPPKAKKKRAAAVRHK